MSLRNGLSRNASAEEANGIIAFTTRCVVIELDTAIAIRAAGLCRTHGLATADAIIYATALHADADLLTCDAHFEGLEKVVYLPKGG
jgi:predicted nucleic acid-binding protein